MFKKNFLSFLIFLCYFKG